MDSGSSHKGKKNKSGEKAAHGKNKRPKKEVFTEDGNNEAKNFAKARYADLVPFLKPSQNTPTSPGGDLNKHNSGSQASPQSRNLRRTIFSPNITEFFDKAREKRLDCIKSKIGEKIDPVAGNIIKLRQSGVNLKSLKNLGEWEKCAGSRHKKQGVIKMTPVRAAYFKFNLNKIQLCSYGFIIPNDAGKVGVEEVESGFLASPGVDPALIPPGGWVKNHYRWIVWKLAATERRFPVSCANYLSIRSVLKQLQYRYNREVNLAERPALCHVLQRDTAAGARMVLCVAEVHTNHMVLTDGWYGVRAVVDESMKHLICSKKVQVGTKLMVHGAELVGSGDGCHPLQQTPDTALKIWTNSTRRVRWDTKMGFYEKPGPMNIDLSSVLAYGGVVGEVRCSVARVYPLVFEYKDGLKLVVRGELAERAHGEVLLDKVKIEERDKLTREWEAAHERRCSFKTSTVDENDGKSLYLALDANPNFSFSLTLSQRDLANKWICKKREKFAQTLDKRIRARMSAESSSRSVRLRLVTPGQSEPSALLSVWEPNPEFLHLARRPGACLRLLGCVAAGRQNGELCLAAAEQSEVLELPSVPLYPSVERTVTPISSVYERDFQPLYGEVDIVGLVSRIGATSKTQRMQTVTLCDAAGYQVVLCFWCGIESHGLTHLLTPGETVSASNLQWRRGVKIHLANAATSLPCLQATEVSQFSTHPDEPYLRDALQNLRATLDPIKCAALLGAGAAAHAGGAAGEAAT